MLQNRTQATTMVPCQKSSTWVQTVSSVTILTVGLQGVAASAVSAPVVTFSEPVEEFAAETTADATVTPSPVEAVEPVAALPRFSQFRTQVQEVLQRQPSRPTQAIARLETHQRELHRHANAVEVQLLSLQELLSIQAYGTSFADRLLVQDNAYQSKLQQLQILEAELHSALAQADPAMLNPINLRLQLLDRELRHMAQQMLTNHMEQAQRPATSGLWQEPIYRESLRGLMDHTHERHLVQVRQQTLARTLVAMAAN